MERLETLCYLNLVSNIHSYTPEVLSCLPTSLHQLLLTRLPAVDLLKLEHTKEVDMNKVWKTICGIRLPDDIPFTLENHDNWKDYYFAVTTAIIINIHKASHDLYCSLRESIYDFLFGFQNFFTSPKYSKYSSFLPERYAHFEDTLTSASSLARYITDTCFYHPKTLHISCSLFYYSQFFSGGVPVEGEIGSALRELVSEVSELVISSDDTIMEMWDSENDRLWEEQKKFYLGAIYAIETVLSHESPKLESLIMTKKCSVSLLDSIIFALDLFYEEESQDVEVAPWRENIIGNLPYGSLKKICVSLGSSDGMPSIFAPMRLASVIAFQSMLETVQISNWPPQHSFADSADRKDFFKLSSVVSNLFFRDQFSSLLLEHTAISTSHFQTLLQGLFERRGTQERKKCLTLDSVNIHKTQSLCEVKVPIEHLENFQDIALCLRNMSLDSTSQQILYSYPVLKLKALELDNVSPVPIDIFLECRDPYIQELVLINSVMIHSPSVNPFSAILGCCSLNSLRITLCDEEPDALASLLVEALHKNFKHVALQCLDLSGNNFGNLPATEFCSTMKTIFSLSCLKQMTLNLSENQLSSSAFLLLNKSWRQKASGIKLKELICLGCDAKSEDLFLLKEMASNVIY